MKRLRHSVLLGYSFFFSYVNKFHVSCKFHAGVVRSKITFISAINGDFELVARVINENAIALRLFVFRQNQHEERSKPQPCIRVCLPFSSARSRTRSLCNELFRSFLVLPFSFISTDEMH